MPHKLITPDKARKEIERLRNYIELVECYEVDTLEQWIIKKYAETNSIKKILEIADNESIKKGGIALGREYVTSVIIGKTKDELHRIIRLGFIQKYKPNKRNYERY
ncbi:hypothetical protein VBD025_02865 [Virgibacillus flavescens]|uniref:hypothetical protein n=1 Tax=Virgibacillus flavescens TaxID=1611422 RepID=UPI003D3441D4